MLSYYRALMGSSLGGYVGGECCAVGMGTAGEGVAVQRPEEPTTPDPKTAEPKETGNPAGCREVCRELFWETEAVSCDRNGEPAEGGEVSGTERGSRRVHVGSGNPEAVQRDTVGVGVEERALHSSCAQLCRPGNAEDCAGGE